MPVAIVIIAIGGLMVYSALKGTSVADAFKGIAGPVIDPSGHHRSQTQAFADASGVDPIFSVTDKPPTVDLGGGFKTTDFKGPNASLLAALASTAVNRFDLRITQICRPQNATYGAKDSLHKACRAFDSTGSVANRVAFAKYAKEVPGVDEVFCDQAGLVAPGFDHSDHVHVGA